MPVGFIVFVVVIVIGAWLAISEKAFGEKILLMAVVAGIYVTYRLLGGETMNDIFAPVIEFFKSRNPNNL